MCLFIVYFFPSTTITLDIDASREEEGDLFIDDNDYDFGRREPYPSDGLYRRLWQLHLDPVAHLMLIGL